MEKLKIQFTSLLEGYKELEFIARKRSERGQLMIFSHAKMDGLTVANVMYE